MLTGDNFVHFTLNWWTDIAVLWQRRFILPQVIFVVLVVAFVAMHCSICIFFLASSLGVCVVFMYL